MVNLVSFWRAEVLEFPWAELHRHKHSDMGTGDLHPLRAKYAARYLDNSVKWTLETAR
jgi:hypothetical protein